MVDTRSASAAADRYTRSPVRAPQAREVAQRRDVQVLAVREGGAPVAFAQLERDGAAAAEITRVYAHPKHRGGGAAGRGTAMTRAAIEAAATCGI